jgi:hypothetical protein
MNEKYCIAKSQPPHPLPSPFLPKPIKKTQKIKIKKFTRTTHYTLKGFELCGS